MRSEIKPAHSLRVVTSLKLWNLRAAFVAALLVAVGVAASASRDWQQTVSAQKFQDAESAAAGLPGELDLSFGVDGTVAADLGNNLNDSATSVAVQPDGKVVAAGYVSTASTGKDFAIMRLNLDGTPDISFSDDGKHSFNFNSATRDDIARAVAVQPDGKIVVAGEADVLGFGNFDIVLARLNADGTFDTSFGNGGKVSTNLPNNRADFGRSLALLPDGRILVAGYSNRPTTGDDFVVVRYNANGSPDTTFDTDGFVTTDILVNREDRASSMALQPDNKIVVAGYTSDPSFRKDFAIVRYDVNGALDPSFGGTGKVSTDLNLNSDDLGNAVAIQNDDRIVVAGQSAADFGVVRYNSNGTLDTGFGGDGIVTTNFGTGATDIGRAVVVQSSGKITVAGRSRSELALARYNFDGTLDTSFDLDGLRVQNSGNNYISAFGGYWGMALKADGKIVAAGDGWQEGSLNDFTISRLNADGTFDFSFGGGDGLASTDIRGRVDEARSVAIQPDGKIVVAGSAQNATGGYDFAAARYNVDGTPDTSFSGDGIVTTDIGGHPDERAYAVALQPDGKIVVAGYTDNASDGNLEDGALLRYNPNGTLDSTFGSGGIVVVTGGAATGGLTWLRNKSIALQPDGKIVVAGEAHYFSVHCDGFVARYNSNGTLDGSFGVRPSPNATVSGFLIVHSNVADTFNAVALQSDGKIVAAGSSDVGTSAASTDFLLARLTTNGHLDTSFDGDGKVLTNFDNSHYDAAYDIVIQPDGKLIAVGETIASGTGNDFAIARYNPNGSLDTTFGGGGGTAHIDFLNYRDYCSGVALQPDGKIILSGFVDAQIDTGFGVVKLNQNGTFDTNFGGGSGKVRTLFGDAVGTALGPIPYDMALQSDGKIVVVGRVNFNSTESDVTVVRYVNSSFGCSYTLNPTSTILPAAGANVSFNVIAPSGCAWAAQSNATWITTGSSGDGFGTAFLSVAANTSTAPRAATVAVGGQLFTVTQRGLSSIFCGPGITISEGAGSAGIVVTRSGDTTGAVSVDYATSSVTASDRSDYLPVVGTLQFAPGETTKTVTALVIDDTYGEGPETFTLALSNPAGAMLDTPSTATATIQSNETVDAPSPVRAASFVPQFFVRQHYLDFFNREPDGGGLAFWTGQTTGCGNADLQVCRNNVSAAFFLSIEFQETGYFVYKMYQAAYGARPGEPVPTTLREFLPDLQQIGRDVIIGNPGAVQQLEANKAAYANAFVARPRFAALGAMTGAQFIDALNANTENALTDAQRANLVSRLNSAQITRAEALREVAQNASVNQKFFTRAFVLMQYYGYLRRNPNDSPELNLNFDGYNFWLGKLNQFGGNHITSQMVQGFITSGEYERRFGP